MRILAALWNVYQLAQKLRPRRGIFLIIEGHSRVAPNQYIGHVFKSFASYPSKEEDTCN